MTPYGFASALDLDLAALDHFLLGKTKRQDAIGELRALFEKPQSDDQVKWFLLRWFRDNEDSIKGALGLGGEPSQEDGADASAGVQLGPK